MSQTWGMIISSGVVKVLDHLERGIIYLANHWEEISRKLFDAADFAYRAAALYLKVQATRTIVGGTISGVGGAVGTLGGIGSGITNAGTALAQMGATTSQLAKAGVWGVAIMATLAAALTGLTLAFSGAVAFWIDRWDEVVAGFYNGQIVLTPILEVLDLFWNRLLAIGEVWMGTNNTVEASNSLITGVATAFQYISDVLGAMLYVTGAVSVALNAVGLQFKVLYMAILQFVKGIVWLVSKIPGLGVKGNELDGHIAWVQEGIDTSLADITDSKWFEMGKKYFDAGTGGPDNPVDRFTKYLEEQKAMKNVNIIMDAIDKNMNPLMQDIASGKYKPKMTAGKVNIEKVIVTQNIRTNDPDRVISGFNRSLQKATHKATAAVPQIPGMI
jgi:hypothetical protein